MLFHDLTSDDARITIGRGTYATTPPLLRPHHANNRIEIGKFCSFAEGVSVFSGGNHPMGFITTHPLKLYLGIEGYADWSADCGDDNEITQIGNDVWLGHEACILSGSKIGDGAIIGARAVVRGDVPPYAIVIGNPAKVIRYRFDSVVIATLLKEKWWDWPEEKIRRYAKTIASNNVDGLFGMGKL